MSYWGYIIYRERMRRNWKQVGLCKGICTVSYLSKIETGKAEPSEEVLRLLLERLELKCDRQIAQEAADLAAQAWELLFAGRFDQLCDLLREKDLERYRAVHEWLDLTLLSSRKPLSAALESCMDSRQLALQRIYQEQETEAVRLMPNAYTYLMLGLAGYRAGNYSSAIDSLQTAYDLASRDGLVRIMLKAKLYIGNAYCNQQDLPNIESHYQIARRLAEDLQDQNALYFIGYNTASTWIEIGRYEEAYKWFAKLENPTVLSLHKLAISCEKTGRPEEAVKALNQAEGMALDDFEWPFVKQMLQLVRYRLDHQDYLARDEYGSMLLECFHRLRSELPPGYAIFHLPWVIDWYKASRQYKKACELMEEFPKKIL